MDDHYSRVLAELDHELAADAMTVAEGVYARVTLADRLRAAVGGRVELVLATDSDRLVGRLADVAADSVLLVESVAYAVRLATVESVLGLPAGHRAAQSPAANRRSLATLLRPWTGHPIRLRRMGGISGGRLERVGADHLQWRSAAQSVVVPFAAVIWVAGPVLDQ